MSTKTNLVINQGATFIANVALTYANGQPMALTGYVAVAQLRKWYSSTNAVSFTISINASSGVLTLDLDPTVTAVLDAGRYVYDVNITSPANTTIRVVEGIATVTPGVTR